MHAHDDAALGILLQCARGANIGAGRMVALVAAHGGFKALGFNNLYARNQLIAVFHGLFKAHAVVGGNAGHFTAAAGAAFVGYDLDMFSHGPFPRMQRAGP